MSITVGYMDGYVQRVIDLELDDLFGELPAILLDGPKGVGKTATALQRASSVWRLDDEAQRQVVAADPNTVATGDPPILVDEWQRVSSTFDVVRRAVDENPRSSRFLLTGSAIPVGRPHSGAGRITTMRMRPLSMYERLRPAEHISFRQFLTGGAALSAKSELELVDYVDEIVAGGFPGMRHLGQRALARQLDSYLDRIVDHELVELGFNVKRPATIRAWLRAYAAAESTAASFEKIRRAANPGDAAPPAKTTVLPYIELLTQLRVLDPLEAWQPSFNHLINAQQSPKHHLADPSLSARLVRLSATKLIRGGSPAETVAEDGTYLGALFEALSTLSVRTYAQAADARVYHLRTARGDHEVDLIVESESGIVALEVKLGSTIDDQDVQHITWLQEVLGDRLVDSAVITTGPYAYRRKDGIAVIPLGLLGP